jgi:hypothetical protein
VDVRVGHRSQKTRVAQVDVERVRHVVEQQDRRPGGGRGDARLRTIQRDLDGEGGGTGRYSKNECDQSGEYYAESKHDTLPFPEVGSNPSSVRKPN